MAVAEHESGSQTATIGTEHFLGTDNDGTDAFFQYLIDVSAMAFNDILEIRLYEKTRAADSVQEIHVWRLKHAQTNKQWVSPGIIFLHNRRASIKQTAGTGRAFPWSSRKVT
jgi:hypothetical protein